MNSVQLSAKTISSTARKHLQILKRSKLDSFLSIRPKVCSFFISHDSKRRLSLFLCFVSKTRCALLSDADLQKNVSRLNRRRLPPPPHHLHLVYPFIYAAHAAESHAKDSRRNNRLIPPLPKNKQLNDGGMKDGCLIMSLCVHVLLCKDMKNDRIHMQRRDGGNYDAHALNSLLHLRYTFIW